MSIVESLIFAIVFTLIRFLLDKDYKKPKTKWLFVKEVIILGLVAFVLINLIEFVL